MILILICFLIAIGVSLWIGGVISGKVALGLIALVLALVPAVFWFLQALVTELNAQIRAGFCGGLSAKERARRAVEDAHRNSRPQPLTLRQASKKAWDEEKRRSQN